MTVAPELPPVLARRAGSRRLRVVVDRTPAGVVALVEPARPGGPPAPVPSSVVVPAPPREPGIGREHRPADPTSRGAAAPGRQQVPADPAFRGPGGSGAVMPGRRSAPGPAGVHPRAVVELTPDHLAAGAALQVGIPQVIVGATSPAAADSPRHASFDLVDLHDAECVEMVETSKRVLCVVRKAAVGPMTKVCCGSPRVSLTVKFLYSISTPTFNCSRGSRIGVMTLWANPHSRPRSPVFSFSKNQFIAHS